MVALVLLVLIQRRRPSAHQTHLPAEHIPELGQLIDGGAADKAPHLCDAGVIVHLEHESLHFVMVHQVLFAGLGILVHAAQFVDGKNTAIEAHPFLFEKQGPGRFQFQRDCHHGDDRDGENQPQNTAHNVHGAF